MSIAHKLRNKLSPIYGLADMVLEIKENPELLDIVIECAQKVKDNKDDIDEILSQLNDLED